ncbi:hypothetical protein DA075_00445 [Methylobacterium currus]|jgi:hypothetical protein|uniref:DUF2946 domain-containing protein n=1 Tax=Methylobacterium currus TaxID=2051553 RepID=A0A2R4WDL3_9HYPH|nr:hypothetical protein DA075_00445 [Methylobacterium currus]
MQRGWTSWRGFRAAVAVAALYALALQALLTGAVATAQPGLPHILCAPDVGSSPDDPVKAPPVHHHLACCTAAHSLDVLTVPVLGSALIAWPVRRIVGASWRPEVVARPRAPPGAHASARAPPIA